MTLKDLRDPIMVTYKDGQNRVGNIDSIETLCGLWGISNVAGNQEFCAKTNIIIQSTLVISKSKGPSETVRDIRTSTYQICSIEEKTI